MGVAAELRKQIESALAERIPAALSFRPLVAPELLSCGLAEVDAALGGGLPLGAISELTGAHSSGRTTLALSMLAEITRQGESCAYVDVSDSLDPASAAALGVELRHMLWIRAGERAGVAIAGSPFPAMAISAKAPEETFRMGGWRHPRHEAVGLHHAVGELFQSVQAERADFTPRCAESMRREQVQPVRFAPVATAETKVRTLPVHPHGARETGWARLDRGLRASDLLLSTGGFRAIVLDLGDVSAEQARRVPLATWYRFRLQAEKSRTLFLLMSAVACANSCAAVSLHCEQDEIEWREAEARGPRLLTGLRYKVRVVRRRTVDPTLRKPVASAEAMWSSTATWSR